MLVVVPIGVDAVGVRDLAVAVVVTQVLPPEPLVVECVLIAVWIGGDHKPQLGVLEQALDLLVVHAPLVDEEAQEAPVDLDADPLSSVLVGHVEGRRPCPVGDLVGALGDLERDQLAALVGVAEDFELDELRVVPGQRPQLIANAARLVPRTPDCVPGCGLLGRELGLRLAVFGFSRRDFEPASLKAGALLVGQHDVDLDAVANVAHRHHVKALPQQGVDVACGRLDRVDLELVLAAVAAAFGLCARDSSGERENEHEREYQSPLHRRPPSPRCV